MSTSKWGDKPLTLVSTSQTASAVSAATSQFLNSVPVTMSRSVATPIRKLTLQYVVDGSVIDASGSLTPMDTYLFEFSSELQSIVQFLAAPDALRDVSERDKYIMKRSLTLSEILNRVRLFSLDLLGIKLSQESIKQVFDAFASFSTQGPPPPPPPPKDVVDPVSPDVTASRSPGRRDESEYNHARGKFLVHQVQDLMSSDPSAGTFLQEYWRTIPSSTRDGWRETSHTGVLMHVPLEPLAQQTLFATVVVDGIMTLRAGGVDVARFQLQDVTSLSRQHHYLKNDPATKQVSEYDKITSAHSVIFFTPAAIRWMIQNKCSDSMVSPQHIRVCVGFDPVFARWTRDGFAEAAMLMDDKLSSIGKQRMVNRVLSLTQHSPMSQFFFKSIQLRFRDYIDQYAMATRDPYGPMPDLIDSSSIPADQSLLIDSLREEISVLKQKLDVAVDSPAVPSSGNPKLLELINTLKAQNRALLLKQTDVAAAKPDRLVSYLHDHVCVNQISQEKSLLSKLNCPDDLIDSLFQKRIQNRQRFEARLSKQASEAFSIERDGLNEQINDLNLQLAELSDSMAADQDTIMQLNDRITLLNDEMAQLKARNIQLNAENERMAKATKIDDVFCSPVPPSVSVISTNDTSADVDPVDLL